MNDFGTNGGGSGLYLGPGLPLPFPVLGNGKAGRSPMFRLRIDDSRFLSWVWHSRRPNLDASVDVDGFEVWLGGGKCDVVIQLLRWWNVSSSSRYSVLEAFGFDWAMLVDVWLTVAAKAASWLIISSVSLWGAVVGRMVSGTDESFSSMPISVFIRILIFPASGFDRRNHDILRRNIVTIDASLDLNQMLVGYTRGYETWW